MSERLLRWRQDKALKTEQTRQAAMEITENLLQTANDSARHVRNFYITFLLLALYISVIVWSTTDEMLLRISPVTLPLLNLKLPIKGFYAFAPYLFLITHFNLLMQLNLLASMLHRLKNTDWKVCHEQIGNLCKPACFRFPSFIGFRRTITVG